MTDLSRWMVALDLTRADSHIMRYTSFLTSYVRPEKIYFVHIDKELDEEMYFKEEFSGMKAQILNEKKLKCQYYFDQYFSKKDIQYEIVVRSGIITQELLYLSRAYAVNLIVAGVKDDGHSKGLVTDRLSRKAACPFILVPEHAPVQIKNVLIPHDLSDYSLLATQMAEELFQYLSIRVHFLHIYQVPDGFSKTGKSYDEFSEIVRRHGHEKLNMLSKDLNLSSEIHVELKGSHNISDLLLTKVEALQAHLVIMGSKGQSNAALALLGSTTTRFLSINKKVPLLVVKKPDENIGLLEAIGKL